MLQFATIKTNKILLLTTVDSTNTYAAQAIHHGKSEHGMVVQALTQTAGRGQRGAAWQSGNNENLLISYIVEHTNSDLQDQFILNMAVSIAIKTGIQFFVPSSNISVKWSNDVFINDHKVCGILIENIIRGANWTHSIIGVGVNVNTHFYNTDLVNPTSIALHLNGLLDLKMFRNQIINSLNNYLDIAKNDPDYILKQYNKSLYKKGEWQMFTTATGTTNKIINGVHANGQIELQDKHGASLYNYGDATQIIGSTN